MNDCLRSLTDWRKVNKHLVQTGASPHLDVGEMLVFSGVMLPSKEACMFLDKMLLIDIQVKARVHSSSFS